MHLVILFSFLMEKKAGLFGDFSLNLKVLIYTGFFYGRQRDLFIYLFIFAMCNLMTGEPKNLPQQKCWRCLSNNLKRLPSLH